MHHYVFFENYTDRYPRGMSSPSAWDLVPVVLAAAIPLLLALTAVSPAGTPLHRLERTLRGTAVLAVVAALWSVWSTPADTATPTTLAYWIGLDAIRAPVLVLVCVLALVVARYCRTYLAGERGLSRFARALAATLAAVTSLVISRHLAVMALAWTCTSLAFHELLTFHPDRPKAQLAARKKFLLSRAADACVLVALLLLAGTTGSLHVDAIARWVESHATLPAAVHVAATLLTLAVVLKTAQLPFHGWLIQVMEAPTPVSALLHAGIVNIGGLLLLCCAPLVEHVPVARAVLVAFGLPTALVAALMMTTRPTVKESLAWSTVAQMGFMLVQCGIAAWHLALLHLLAHSCYKAHAFLSAGGVVARTRRNALARAPRPRATALVLAAGLIGLATAAIAAVIGSAALLHAPEMLLLLVAVTTLLAPSLRAGAPRRIATGLLASAVLVSGYVAWHVLFARAAHGNPSPFGAWLAATGVAALFVVHTLVRLAPDGRLAAWLHARLPIGSRFDDWATRTTLRIWPTRPATATRTLQLSPSTEEIA